MNHFVSPHAQIHPSVELNPYVVIEDDVVIGEGSRIGSHAVIMNGVRLGKHVKIFTGAVLGTIPQDKKYKGEQTLLEIGDHVTIREYCTLNIGTDATGKTVIGDHSLLMAYVHIAHDCVIGQHVVLSNNVNLAGHVNIGDYAILGGLVAVHQFGKVGKLSMVGGGTLVRKDIPPYVKAAREPVSYTGVNRIGMERAGMAGTAIHHIQDIYRVLFVKGYRLQKSLDIIENEIEDTEFKHSILEFITNSQRGIMRGFMRKRSV